MADLIVRANSGAMKGLAVLGYPNRNTGPVAAVLSYFVRTLNEELPESVKILSQNGGVEIVSPP
jgi:hypothetical protein